MDLELRAYSVLIVSSNEKFTKSISALLNGTSFKSIDCSPNVSSARRLLNERTYDIVLINTPLTDEYGTKFATDLSSSGNTVTALFVKNDMYSETVPKVSKHGVLVVPKPSSTQTVTLSIDWLCAVREKLKNAEKKTQNAQKKLDEMRIINRAKWLLIEEEDMTEEEAHKHIEKTAMDKCLPKRVIAESIIQLYS